MASPSSQPHNTFLLQRQQPFAARDQNATNNNTTAMNQLDEGYSEEMRSQSDGDTSLAGGEDVPVRSLDCVQAVMGLPPKERQQAVLEIIRTLENSLKEDVRRQVEAMTHFDPALYLPVEVFLQIFSYVSPKDLLNASVVSRAWRERAFDERTWKRCFAQEGWVVDKESIEAWERGAERQGRQRAEAMLQTSGAMAGKAVPSLQRRESRKRTRGEAFQEGERLAAARWNGLENRSLHPEKAEEDDVMEGVEVDDSDRIAGEDVMSDHGVDLADMLNREDDPYHTYDTTVHGRAMRHSPMTSADFKIRPTIYQSSTSGSSLKLSWSWMYKQRRKLEANWDNNRHVMFQLPRLEYPEDGHDECVYTIQHTARHLVSGSRDMTIRIWCLATYRLKCEPLRGHKASVLCLQFDEKPEQDIIVSGGSDSSVIIWKFSTGELIKHIEDAHEESVLNLRFDDRYIVTCSKDKTIKIWNRHPIPRNSPLIPKASLEEFADPVTAKRGGKGELIDPFTLLSTIHGHGAAVNAVMIYNNTIVSASGDRTVRAWDIITGKTTKNYSGHNKGIACVQFDGRRVVSGSSDNSVRIFDAVKEAEVACLRGHNNLVRTVQARFGDMETTTDAELDALARKADREFERAKRSGRLPQVRRSAIRNTGSSDPAKMAALGAKIPPGGGGTPWAKIVSGSYDETVIVWRKNRDGDWQPQNQLSQATLLSDMRRDFIAAGGTPQNHLMQVATAQGNPAQLAQIQAQLQAPAHTTHQTQTQTHHHHAAAPAAAAAPHAPAQPHHHHHHAHGHQHGQAANNNREGRDSFRIFKLQFDARRIICCSQNKTIVGWDFANGEKELEKIGDWSLETA